MRTGLYKHARRDGAKREQKKRIPVLYNNNTIFYEGCYKRVMPVRLCRLCVRSPFPFMTTAPASCASLPKSNVLVESGLHQRSGGSAPRVFGYNLFRFRSFRFRHVSPHTVSVIQSRSSSSSVNVSQPLIPHPYRPFPPVIELTAPKNVN